ncbi:hypothetical protein KJ570_01845 [Patescibacteria group bacterium]|nr:hypothetical protein [Patescibacteria group bacterium]MBU2035844.1 hypothetical protein [Patescibacteria group bacterium]
MKGNLPDNTREKKFNTFISKNKRFFPVAILIALVFSIAFSIVISRKYKQLNKKTKSPLETIKTIINNTMPTTTDYVSQRKYNFTLDSLNVGDKFGELEVTAIEPYNLDYGQLAENNLKISFSGSIKISGKYTNDIKGGPMAGKIYFDPSREDYNNVLPSIESYKKDGLSIIFFNQEYAEQLLGGEGSSGEVTIIAEDLILVYYPAEPLNSFKLVDIAE